MGFNIFSCMYIIYFGYIHSIVRLLNKREIHENLKLISFIYAHQF